ncbi:ATP-binding protein [Streptomyces humicola]|uniref:ATP-binding protein n=1 Tax=Streptomyces humicola TaxID=2953240 RepID=UPI0035585F8B
MHQVTFSLPTTDTSVPKARHQVGAALARYGLDPPSTDTALLILTELVTNAVIHASDLSPRVDIAVAVRSDHLVIAVHDRHPHRPRVLPACRPDGGGWGLKMVTDLTTESGGTVEMPADPDRHGKTVRVTLPHRAA